ncbi:MAG: hypothetical protein H6Q27_1342 [Ignavibacteriaceae bacterium]|nr:hypothetical protein [Ignavibacteriaceae bacterium]
MKKLIIFILLVAGGYFAYEYLLKEKTVLEINADKNISTQYSTSVDAPAMTPSRYAKIDRDLHSLRRRQRQMCIRDRSKQELTN